ncbi:MAG: IS66 family transposase [Isosphaeraceae bacterium]
MSFDFTAQQLANFGTEAEAVIRALLAENQRLKDRLAELEARKTPQNSSMPPSTQHPHARPSPKPRPKKKQGGQRGHKKHERALIPTERCDDVQTLKPLACRRCGTQLSGTDPQPRRHQVWELPEIKPHVTEYQRHRLVCPHCRQTTCAALPTGVPTGQSGPRLVAFAGLLMAYFRQSKRRTARFMQTLLNQPCCPSLAVKMQTLVADAVQPACDQLTALLPDQACLSIDESPTKQKKSKAWLWTFVAQSFTVFAVRTSRAATILDDLLTERFRGIVTCDRAKMYWQCGRLQWCWAHLKRDFQALIDHPDRRVKRLGHDLMRPTKRLFGVWARYRDGTIDRRRFQREMQPIRQEIEWLLLRGAFSESRRLRGMCQELSNHREWLWAFVEHDGIEPTNNASERALRHGVIWRKLSFGTQSVAGSRFVSNLLTVIETCRQQERPVFEYLTAAVAAHFAQTACPPLVPDP